MGLLPLNLLLILLSIPEYIHTITSGSSPAFRQSSPIEVGLEASELERAFLDDSLAEERSGFDHKNIDYIKK